LAKIANLQRNCDSMANVMAYLQFCATGRNVQYPAIMPLSVNQYFRLGKDGFAGIFSLVFYFA